MWQQQLNTFVIRHLSWFVLIAVLVFALSTAYWLHQLNKAQNNNQAFADQSILNHHFDYDNHLHAYSIAYLLAQQDDVKKMNKAFEIAEVSKDAGLRATVKFAIGNTHFQNMLKDFGKERGNRRIVEQVILAREAYKAALRIQPDLYVARYNLELLDRLSPEKRTQGFKTGDGYTYQITPQLQDGRMHMKDNTIRGLP